MWAHFLTWTTYGTWLPGDERGFVSRVPGHPGKPHVMPNVINTPRAAPSRALEVSARQRMQGDAVMLSLEQAQLVAETIADAARRHDIRLIVCAVMHTHVHVLTENLSRGGPVQLQLFKGSTSRALTLRFGRPSGRWWTKSGSAKPKFEAHAKRLALEYVLRHEALAWGGVCAPDVQGGRGGRAG